MSESEAVPQAPPDPPKPAVTSDESLRVLRAALNFDIVFAEEFKILRPYLGRISRQWPYQIHEQLLSRAEIKEKFSSADAYELDQLMEAYITELRTGRFYENFFLSVENLAAFFIDRDVPDSWLIGAFMQVFHEAQLEIFFDKEARNGRIVVAALRCLLKIMTLTIQILNAASFAKPGQPAADAQST